MQVSANNIIRFPVAPLAATRPAEPQEAPARIVDFPSSEIDDRFGAEAQDHGKLFAAHRIVARVAAQLDETAAL